MADFELHILADNNNNFVNNGGYYYGNRYPSLGQAIFAAVTVPILGAWGGGWGGYQPGYWGGGYGPGEFPVI